MSQAASQPEQHHYALDAAALLAAQQASAALRKRTLAMLGALFRNLDSWHQADAERFVPQAVRISTAAQKQTSHLTAASLDRYATTVGEDLAPAEPLAGYVRDGVTPQQVYARPFSQLWWELGNGKPLQQAVEDAARRLENIAATDMQLAKTKTAQQVLSASEKVVGYRRVLEGTYSCGLCIVASTQRYHKDELMPLHPGCDCSVAPIFGDKDPGKMINLPALQAAHAAIEERFGTASPSARNIWGAKDAKGVQQTYRDVIIEHHNDEIGTVMDVRRGSGKLTRGQEIERKRAKAAERIAALQPQPKPNPDQQYRNLLDKLSTDYQRNR